MCYAHECIALSPLPKVRPQCLNITTLPHLIPPHSTSPHLTSPHITSMYHYSIETHSHKIGKCTRSANNLDFLIKHFVSASVHTLPYSKKHFRIIMYTFHEHLYVLTNNGLPTSCRTSSMERTINRRASRLQ